jgi:hypothetical protein
MKIEYEFNYTDRLAFGDYLVKYSPGRRKVIRRIRWMFGGIFLLAGIMILVLFPGKLSVSGLFLVVMGLLCITFYPQYYRWSVKRHTAAILKKNGLYDKSEIVQAEVVDDLVVTKSDSGELKMKLAAIETVAKTDTHTFIFSNPENALIINKKNVMSGNLDSFLAELKNRIKETNTDISPNG